MAFLEIILGVILHVVLVYMCFKYKDSIYRGVKLFLLKTPVLVAISMVLAAIFHPGAKGEYFVTLQMMVSFSIFLEAFSLLP